jgi:hypothetical protein
MLTVDLTTEVVGMTETTVDVWVGALVIKQLQTLFACAELSELNRPGIPRIFGILIIPS